MYSGLRRLAAIMFTDMVGFTSIGQENEALSLELLEEQRRLVRPIISRYGGKEIKTIGDAFLIEFPSALQATRCAFDIQQSIHEFNTNNNSANRNLRLRIGIHLGDVTQSENDIYGDAVNVASRIEALAEPGSICITQQVFDQIKNKFEFPFSSLGNKELKNVSEPVAVYSVVLPWQRVRVNGGSDFSKRIAVLPFTNMIPDPNDEYFADGMTEEMISAISKISGIEVVSRTSVMQYKKLPKPIKEVSRELEVGMVLEGSVRKASNKLRVSVQMIDATKDRHIWAESYDRDMQNVFEIQFDIAQRVSEVLADKTLVNSPKNAQELTNPEAFEHYLRGRYFWNQKELDGLNKALVEFGKAIEKDPKLAQGYAGLADTYLLLGRNGHVLAKFAYPKAIENAQKAIELDPRLPDPHTALGAILQEYEWKWDEAGIEFRRAITLNSSYANGRSWYALYQGHLGRFEEALEEIRLAQKLDPLSPRIHCVASEEYLFARMYDKCIEAAERALEINPNFGGAYGYRAYPLVEKRMYDKAIEDFQEAGRQQGARAWMGRLGHVYGISGNRTEATKILEKLKAETNQPPPKSPFLPPPPNTAFDIGLVYLGLGENVQAIEWFEKAADARTAEIIHIKSEPIYDSIQREERFIALKKRIGLE